jgi:hypothetical protein
MRVHARVAPIAVVLVVLSGCGTSHEPRAATTEAARTSTATTPAVTTTTTTARTTTPTVPPKKLSSDEAHRTRKAACEQPKSQVYNPTSAPYAGPGPHYIDVYEVPLTNRRMQHSLIVAGATKLLPSGSTLDFDHNLIQLFACVVPVLGKRSGKVTCRFDQGVAKSRTWPLYEASYRVTVREARTGREIKVVTLPGTESPEESCPGFATDDPGTVVARSLTGDVLDNALRPLLLDPV